MEHLGNLAQKVGLAVHNVLNFEKQKQKLKRKLEELESMAADISIETEHAESSSGKRRKNEVIYWLKEVERIKDEGMKIVQEQGLKAWDTLFRSRIEEMTAEVTECIQNGRFEGGLVLDAPNAGGDLLLEVKMVGREFQNNMVKILECLGNDMILRVGVYGMGGVGKTTLVTHIHNRIMKNPNTFGDVYWITVTQDFSIYKLQGLIAKTINLDISDEDDEMKRAAKLSKAFKRKGKCVLVFDDLWNDFSEWEVGIPVEVNGCKLILTSRSLEVCRRMDCKVQIKVETLSTEEAWNLFTEKLGREMPLSLEINKITELVVKECDGLPLGIITVAGSLRGVDEISEWRNALRELKEIRQDDVKEKVFQVLRFSYNRLNNWALQQCFLYCALFSEDFNIGRGELIEYMIIEGIIEVMSSRLAQYDKGNAMLNKLENVCLLEGSRECVKMHDLIRDMAIQIMKSGPHETMVESGKQLKEIPDLQGDLLRVALSNNDITEIPFAHSPRCPNLITLLLCRNKYLEMIADSFFNYLPGLKVLDLSGTSVQKLPDYVASLENLTALLLRHCRRLKYVPSLAKLRALKKLDLSNCTRLEEAPEGVELLSNLTYLNLICTEINNLPRGILANLCRLQYLGLGFHSGSSETSKVIMEKIGFLQKLEVLVCWFQDYGDYNSYHFSLKQPQLSKYILFVGPQEQFVEKNVDDYDLNKISREVYFHGSSVIGNEIHVPSKTQELSIYKDVSDGRGLCLKNAVELKCLRVDDVEKIEWLFDMSSLSRYIIQSLETIVLYNLPKLHVFFSYEDEDAAIPALQTKIPMPPNGAFSGLKLFHMYECDSMEKLFYPALMRNLQNLEKLRVSSCAGMEEIIAADEEERGSCNNNHFDFSQTNEFILPKLSVLVLHKLPKLKSIWSGKMICKSLQKIELVDCQKLANIPLSLPLPSLQQLRVWPKEWWEFVKWDNSADKAVFQTSLCNR